MLVVCPARSVKKYSNRVNECWLAIFMRSWAACSGVICGPVYPREARVSRIMSWLTDWCFSSRCPRLTSPKALSVATVVTDFMRRLWMSSMLRFR